MFGGVEVERMGIKISGKEKGATLVAPIIQL
jgi:hypothetical protein